MWVPLHSRAHPVPAEQQSACRLLSSSGKQQHFLTIVWAQATAEAGGGRDCLTAAATRNCLELLLLLLQCRGATRREETERDVGWRGGKDWSRETVALACASPARPGAGWAGRGAGSWLSRPWTRGRWSSCEVSGSVQ